MCMLEIYMYINILINCQFNTNSVPTGEMRKGIKRKKARKAAWYTEKYEQISVARVAFIHLRKRVLTGDWKAGEMGGTCWEDPMERSSKCHWFWFCKPKRTKGCTWNLWCGMIVLAAVWRTARVRDWPMAKSASTKALAAWKVWINVSEEVGREWDKLRNLAKINMVSQQSSFGTDIFSGSECSFKTKTISKLLVLEILLNTECVTIAGGFVLFLSLLAAWLQSQTEISIQAHSQWMSLCRRWEWCKGKRYRSLPLEV